MGRAARRIVVRGLVQGVAFRWHTRNRAQELAVLGWVRNRFDGAVEIHAEGEQEPLNALLEWLDHGPPTATVTEVVSQVVAVEGHTMFEIGPTTRS